VSRQNLRPSCPAEALATYSATAHLAAKITYSNAAQMKSTKAWGTANCAVTLYEPIKQRDIAANSGERAYSTRYGKEARLCNAYKYSYLSENMGPKLIVPLLAL